MPDGSPNSITLRTYEAAAERYRAQTNGTTAVVPLLDRLVAALAPGSLVLEVGSGPGRDALLLEQRGLRVTRTDAARAFVDMLRADGHDAQLLNVITDPIVGQFDGVLADAVLLHLTEPEFAVAVAKLRHAVGLGAPFALTLKEGDGNEWHTRKLYLPRHYTYWREEPLRRVLAASGWHVDWLAHLPGDEPWLQVLCRAA
jgi:SAM-dependent methyltransferase